MASNTPPAGFEDLSRPQKTLVDIYFGNRYLTSQMVTYHPGIIQLSDTISIAQKVGNLNDPAFIASSLSGDLNSNPDRVCLSNTSRDCGQIKPNVTGVIFDESRFRVDVFINRRFMLTRAAEVRKYLPPSDAGFAMLQNFSAAVSGSTADNSSSNYTFNGLSLIAFEENSLYGNWDYSRNNKLSINQLYGQREYQGLEYNLGLMSSQSFGLNFTSDQPMVGARISTSSNTREDLDFTGGTPLEVFLPIRGRVEILKDGRLIDSAFYEAGLQQMNTSGFPDGAYDIEIRIVDEQGNEQSKEIRFFAKQYQLPPVDEWLLFAESGQIVTRENQSALPETTHSWLARAGASRRLMNTLSATTAIAAIDDDVLMELGFYHFGYRYEFTPSFMLANQDRKGININGRLQLGEAEELSLSGYYRRLWQDENASISDNQSPVLLGNAFKQHSLSASIPLLEGSLSYRNSYSQNQSNKATRSNSIDYRRRLFKTYDYDADLTLSLSQSGDNRIAMISVNLRYKKDNWNFRASPRAEITENNGVKDRNEQVRLSASWDDKDLYDSDIRFTTGVETGSQDDRFDSSVYFANRFGRASLNINHTSGQKSATSYGGSLSTSFLTDGNVVAMGGERSAESAIVVDLSGRDGDVFDVKVDGQRRGYAVAGTPSVIPLRPFEQYTVSLSPAGETLYSFDEREKQLTLYPGNVVTLDYEAVPLQLLFGRLLFNGAPVDSARISGGLYPGNTDDIGMFQIEVRSDINAIQVELRNGWLCQLPVDSLEEGYVLQMGTIDLASVNCVPVLEGKLAISQRGDSNASDVIER